MKLFLAKAIVYSVIAAMLILVGSLFITMAYYDPTSFAFITGSIALASAFVWATSYLSRY